MSDVKPKVRTLPLPPTVLPPAATPEEARKRHAANRNAWNEVASGAYAKRMEDTISFLRSGQSDLHPIERETLLRGSGGRPLRDWCRTAIHLQCASGRDTLSLWNEGVERVIGVDISEEHIANARRVAEAVGAAAEWYCCDVLDTPSQLDGTADLVYTGQGALNWLHDLDAWAAVIARLLKPGGAIHVLDDHPATILFDTDAEEPRYSGLHYFRYSESSQGWGDNYVGAFMPAEKQSRKYERVWTISEVVNALIGAGLKIEYVGEHAEGYWDSFPNLRPEMKGRLPLSFSVLARKL
ncbi:MAG: class I SAM-dependent methyltransferase [Candidatus Zixiibacteriota bacterium]